MAISNFLPNNTDADDYPLIDVPAPATYEGIFLDEYFFTTIDNVLVKFPVRYLGIGLGHCKVNPNGHVQRVDADGNLVEHIFC